MPLPALLFDLDGTLVDSAPDLAQAINRMLDNLGKDTYPISTVRAWVGNGAKILVERALSGSTVINPELDPALSKRALECFFGFYRENTCDQTRLYPGVHKTLQHFHNKGLAMAIVTNKPERFIQPITKTLAINDYFSISIGGDSLSTRKPEPEPLLYCCKHLGVPPNQAIMVGDSKNDILAAHAAGVASLGLSYGYNYGEDIGRYKPRWVADEFQQVLAIVDTFQRAERPS